MNKGNVYTVSFHTPFFKTVAKHVLKDIRNPLDLADVHIVVPSPRMAAGLKESFAKALGGSLILPQIRTLSFSEDDLDILRFEEDYAADAVSPLARLMILAHLVKAKSPDMAYSQILDDAWHLGQLFSRFSSYGIELDDLQGVLPDELSEGWKDNLDFLKIACEVYPAWLTEQGKMDGSVKTQEHMKDLVKKHVSAPRMFLAVGFNDTTPAGKHVLKDILAHPVGQVIFPPMVLNEQVISATHPLYALYGLLDDLGVNSSDIQFLDDKPTQSLMLNPKSADEKNTHHIHMLEANSVGEEAEAIALLMRETLETPNKTCALVSPDRGLAQRVVSALRMWDIDVDDSAGQPLKQSPIAGVLMAYLSMVAGRFDAVSVAAFLLHPSVQKMPTAFEKHVLQGVAPAWGISGLRKKLMESRVREEDLPSCLELLDMLDKSTETIADGGKYKLTELITSILDALRFWLQEHALEGDDVDALMGLLSSWVAEAQYVPDMELRTFTKTLEQLMDKVVVRKRFGSHPRLFVWGPMEARLQQIDRIILGGMNEGTWPRKIKADPWLNRNMASQLGLADPQIYVGLSAYDMLHLSAHSEVFWTRTVRDNEGETVPSRFLLKLKTEMPELWQKMVNRGGIWLNRSKKVRVKLGDVENKPERPNITVPVEKRPNTWSPSLLSKYMVCPYQVFVEKILKIEKADAYGEDPKAADKGQLIHTCLEAMVQQVKGLPAPYEGRWQDRSAVEKHLLTIGEAVFSTMEHEGRKAVWWQKFRRLAAGFAEEMSKLEGRQIVAVEESLNAPLKHNIHLKARLDRMDRDAEGNLHILDYKTGQIPPWTKVSTGESPQMGVEAVLAEKNGYMLGGLEYWSVKGERNENVARKAFKGDLEELEDEASKGLDNLADVLSADDFAYTAVPGSASARDKKGACTVCDYAGICRYKNWLGDVK